MDDLSVPPQPPENNLTREWFALRKPDPVLAHIETTFWEQETAPAHWLAARLSPAVHVYCEEATGWKIVAKFHVSKTGKDAGHHAEREFCVTQRAWDYLSSDHRYRAVQPLASRQGVLFLEYVDGLTLEDKIAVRRSRPGALNHSLEAAANLLATLHVTSSRPQSEPDFAAAVAYAHKVLDNLATYGVLQNHPSVQNEMERIVERWNRDQIMWQYRAALNHGDATSSNFIFPPEGGVVAIDWERSGFADPAADLGRLMAEVTHAVNQQGGNFAEGHRYARRLGEAYARFLPQEWEQQALLHRARFYEATSILRIARNGWLSRKDRLALVLQAFALLSR